LVTWLLTMKRRKNPDACTQSPISVTTAPSVCGLRASVPGQRRECPSEQP
jgi:hypothetical protein